MALGLCWPNRASTATVSGGSWNANLPLANIQDRQITKVARSTDALAASTKVRVDMGAATLIRAIELRYHNLTPAATWLIKAGTTAGASDVYLGSLTNVFRSTPEGFTGREFAALLVLPSNITARHWTIEITDTANPAGYVDLGYLFMGPMWSPAINASYGLLNGIVDLSSQDRADGGDQWFLQRGEYRTVQFVLEVITEAEADTMHDMLRTVGTTGDLLYIPRTEDMAYSQRYGYLATMAELTAIEYAYKSYRKMPFRLTERI